jgi:hypothetical protein
MPPFFCEIYADFVAFYARYAPDAPSSVMHIIAPVKRDVFFKISNGFMNITVVLRKIGNADVFFKLAVFGVFLFKASDYFPSPVNVPFIVVKDYF